MGALGEHEAHPHQQHEGADDHCTQREPEEVVLEIGSRNAIKAEIEREVVDEHQAQSATPKRVDSGDAPADTRRALSGAAGGQRLSPPADGRRCRLRLIAAASAS